MERAPHILVADDNRDICEIVQLYLTNEGYRVSCAYTGEEARVAVLDRHIDLVIQEVVLPDALGIDLAVELAKRGTSILLMTDSARLIGMLAHFSFPVVRKPFRLSDLLEAVRAVLATRPAPAT